MKRKAYGGANFVPIAVPDIYWRILLLLKILKKWFFSTNWAILTSLSVGICIMSTTYTVEKKEKLL